VFDAAGNVVVDLADRVSRVLGTFRTGTAAGSITDAGLASGTPFAISTNVQAFGPSTIVMPTFTFSGSTLSWTAPTKDNIVVYGVY